MCYALTIMINAPHRPFLIHCLDLRTIASVTVSRLFSCYCKLFGFAANYIG